MLDIKLIANIQVLESLKAQYLKETTGPLDGMWLHGFLPMATHYGFYDGSDIVGYYCINAEGYMLQFYLVEQYKSQAGELFEKILSNDGLSARIQGAFVSTLEPEYLSLCFDYFPHSKPQTLMYRQSQVLIDDENILPVSELTIEQLKEAVTFAHSAIGTPKEWLRGYYENLINRRELLGYWEEGELVATGECRGSEGHQAEYADLGMIVAKSQRGKGLGTRMIRTMSKRAASQALKAICSTEVTNQGSQKALSRAGFYAANRILQFTRI